MMNAEQRDVIETILDYMENRHNRESRHFFIEGAGGSGKTYIYRTLYKMLMSRGFRVRFLQKIFIKIK